MSTGLDLSTSQLLVTTRASKPDLEFNAVLLARIPSKNATTGIQTLTYFIDLGAKQGSIGQLRKAPH